MSLDTTFLSIIPYLIAYIFLLATSGRLVFYILQKAKGSPYDDMDKRLDTGYIIGKCENILLLTLVFLGQYTAISIIFAAKTIVRQEDIKKDSLFYLAGTLINVTYSIFIGLTTKWLVFQFWTI